MAEITSPSTERRPGAVRAWVMWWALLAALWLLLVDLTALPEMIVGAVAAAIGATGVVVVRRQRDVLPRARLRWLPSLLRALPGLVLDLWPLARALWWRGILRRDEQGSLVEVEYDAVEREPVAAAHRALTESLGSLAPNTIVVSIDLDRRRLLAHQLVPTEDPGRSARPFGASP